MKAKDLFFWNFLNGNDKDRDDVKYEDPFPKQYVSSKQMEFYTNKLHDRIQFYSTSECKNYLDKFYDYYMKTYNSSNKNELKENETKAERYLRLFSICYEVETECKALQKEKN